jgi:hypothetical protein
MLQKQVVTYEWQGDLESAKRSGIYEKSTDQEQNCPEIQTQSWRNPASTGEVPAKEGEAILLQRERIHKRPCAI